jgi:DNA segregation ATPase FtsK/SpoIIIE, S-DNA-T family
MTFPLGSLRTEGASASAASTPTGNRTAKRGERARSTTAVPSSPPRWRHQLLLWGGAVLWLLLLLALLTHDGADAAFTTSGDGAALRNKVGLFGAWMSDLGYFLLGYSVWWLVPIGLRAWLGMLARPGAGAELPQRPPSVVWIGIALLLAASCALEWTRLYHWETHLPGHAGGVLGYTLGPLSTRWLGFAGSGVLWIAALVAGLSLALRFSWLTLAEWIGARFDGLRALAQHRKEQAEDRRIGERALIEREHEIADVPAALAPALPLVIAPAVIEVPKSERVAKERQKPLFVELADTRLPQVDLLDEAPARQESVTPESLEMTSRLIEKKLKDFGVEVRVVAASPGPVITRYEIEPAVGVKGAQVVGLAKDLARSLSLVSIRVVETIPGKNYMALELPNARRQTIRLAEILGSKVYNDAASQLTIALGKDIVGNPVVADLGKMPHCLVAGTTGAGKSVGINAMILSLLYKAEARDVRLILIDPKMLELSVYEGIPHLLCPVVIDMKQAAHALNWCVGEMERRYKLMSKLGVRNLAGYNRKILEAKDAGKPIPDPMRPEGVPESEAAPLQALPYIVVVIDELADLMMLVGKRVEELIARLAQKARASGIHLILATQRPSVDVITGLIKANIPCRIAFQVSSKVDSRTILDQSGAETLLGHGDMLFLPPGTSVPTRVHGAFVDDQEVHRVVRHLKRAGAPTYLDGVLAGPQNALPGFGGDSFMGDDDPEKDPLYDDAVRFVTETRRASISSVQRRLKVGYNRAARMVETMELAGIVGPLQTNGAREVIAPEPPED